MNYISVQEIRLINREVIRHDGGLAARAGLEREEGSLDYLVDKVSGCLYGQPIYETSFQKAAFYAYYIIRIHPFFDGNKRTGVMCCLAFLRMNGYSISSSLESDEIRDMALEIAKGHISLEDIAFWVERVVVTDYGS